MKFLMTCRLCGYQERGSEGRELMNRIKLLNHIEKSHPALAEEFTESLRNHEYGPFGIDMAGVGV